MEFYISRDDRHNQEEPIVQVIEGHFHHLQLNKKQAWSSKLSTLFCQTFPLA